MRYFCRQEPQARTHSPTHSLIVRPTRRPFASSHIWFRHQAVPVRGSASHNVQAPTGLSGSACAWRTFARPSKNRAVVSWSDWTRATDLAWSCRVSSIDFRYSYVPVSIPMMAAYPMSYGYLPNRAEALTATARAQRQCSLPPLESVTRSHVTTAEAAFYLNRAKQTLRAWACKENGPIRPSRVQGRLAWSVVELRRVLGLDVGTRRR